MAWIKRLLQSTGDLRIGDDFGSLLASASSAQFTVARAHPARLGVTTRKCFEGTTSWTKHERAARWYVCCTLNGGRSGGGCITSLTCH